MNELSITDKICYMMHSDALYHLQTLKKRYIEVYDDEEGSKKLAKLLRNGSKENGPFEALYDSSGKRIYKLNNSYIAPDVKEALENENTIRMARIIMTAVQTQNFKILNKWLNDDLMKIINSMIENTVRDEIKNEVVPEIKHAVREKYTVSKKQVKATLSEIITDLIEDMKTEEIV